jgi:hypothetical protein
MRLSAFAVAIFGTLVTCACDDQPSKSKDAGIIAIDGGFASTDAGAMPLDGGLVRAENIEPADAGVDAGVDAGPLVKAKHRH